MAGDDTVTITREEYHALLHRSARLDQLLAAPDTHPVPPDVAHAIAQGAGPVLAYRKHLGLTLRDLSARTGIAIGYLSEIERRRRPGTIAAWARIAAALDTTIDVLVNGVDAEQAS